jgi:hypothetical protein
MRETATWRREKAPIIAKYADDHKALMGEIAGRGFQRLPGYAYDAENRLELFTKRNLSDLNYKILAETVERELKQAGITYDLAHREALMAWEIEKQGLLADWEAELAAIKRGMSQEENLLSLLAIEVGNRAVAFSAAKTAIEEQMETYRKEIAELDAATAPYDIQLANAKLLTAQKKGELIPILEQILAKERELLLLEQDKASELTTYMGAIGEIATKKETLMPFLNDLAGKSGQLADKIVSEQIPKEEQIADEKITQAQAAVTKAGYAIEEINANIQTEQKRMELGEARRDLANTKHDYDQALTTHERGLVTDLQNTVKADHAEGLEDERASVSALRSDKIIIEAARNLIKETSTNTLTNAEKSTNASISASHISEIRGVAEAQAAARLTAGLEHIIG